MHRLEEGRTMTRGLPKQQMACRPVLMPLAMFLQPRPAFCARPLIVFLPFWPPPAAESFLSSFFLSSWAPCNFTQYTINFLHSLHLILPTTAVGPSTV